MILLKKLFQTVCIEWLAVTAMILSFGLGVAFFTKVFCVDWVKTDGIIKDVFEIKNESTQLAGTDGASTSKSKCWVISVEYMVLGKTYRATRESIDKVSTKCKLNDGLYPAFKLPKIGMQHEVWYSKKEVSHAVLSNAFPIFHFIGVFITLGIAVGFLIYLFKKIVFKTNH